jgi:hypothetical protein
VADCEKEALTKCGESRLLCYKGINDLCPPFVREAARPARSLIHAQTDKQCLRDNLNRCNVGLSRGRPSIASH